MANARPSPSDWGALIKIFEEKEKSRQKELEELKASAREISFARDQQDDTMGAEHQFERALRQMAKVKAATHASHALEPDEQRLLTQKLPDEALLVNVTPTWTAETHPFATMSDFETEVLRQTAYRIRALKLKFEVPGPRAFNYLGRQHKFIGMESFTLVWLGWAIQKDDAGKIVNRDARFFFEATGLTLKKAYDLTPTQTVALLGGQPADRVAEVAGELMAAEPWASIRTSIEQTEMRERYAGTGMEFGSW